MKALLHALRRCVMPYNAQSSSLPRRRASIDEVGHQMNPNLVSWHIRFRKILLVAGLLSACISVTVFFGSTLNAPGTSIYVASKRFFDSLPASADHHLRNFNRAKNGPLRGVDPFIPTARQAGAKRTGPNAPTITSAQVRAKADAAELDYRLSTNSSLSLEKLPSSVSELTTLLTTYMTDLRIAQSILQVRDTQIARLENALDVERATRVRLSSDRNTDRAIGATSEGQDGGLRQGWSDPGPSPAQAALLALLLPSPAGGNPIRRAWAMHGLDWHDLVRETVKVPSDTVGSAAYLRADRETAKASLLSLLGGWTFGGAEPRSAYQEADEAGWQAGSIAPPAQAALTYALLATGAYATALTHRVNVRSIASSIGDESATARAAEKIGIDPSDLSGMMASPRERGMLAKYAACDVVRDPCMVHASARACVEDELCGWCPKVRGDNKRSSQSDPFFYIEAFAGMCVGRWNGYFKEKDAGDRVPACAVPLWVTADSLPQLQEHKSGDLGTRELRQVYKLTFTGSGGMALPQISTANCSVIVTRRQPVLLGISGTSKMAYHFYTETVPGWFASLKGVGVGTGRAAYGPSGGLHALSTHVFVQASSVNEFIHMLQPFSDSCPRRTDLLPLLPSGMHVCYAHSQGGSQGRETTVEERAQTDWPWTASALWGRPAPALALWDALTGTAMPWPSSYSSTMWEEVLGSPREAVRQGMRLGLQGMIAVARAVAEAPSRVLQEVSVEAWPAVQAEAEAFLQGAEADGQTTFDGFVHTAAAMWWAHPWPTPAHAIMARGIGHGNGAAATPLPLFRPLVSLLSRRNKRFLINEEEVVRLALALGARVRVVALEDLSLPAQLRILRQTAVLVGVHGSGLINTQYMTRGTAMVQILPPKLSGGAAFFEGPAEGNGVKYFEYKVPLPMPARAGQSIRSTNSTAFHFHFLDSSYGVDGGKRDSLESGSDCCGNGVYFSFWINTDVRVDLAGLGKVLDSALEHYRLNAEVRRRPKKEVNEKDAK